jgi:hypothetical protein
MGLAQTYGAVLSELTRQVHHLCLEPALQLVSVAGDEATLVGGLAALLSFLSLIGALRMPRRATSERQKRSPCN